MNDIKLSKCLFADLKTDAQRRDWFLLGRGVETGVIAPALQAHLVNVYSKLVESNKLIKQQQKQIEELERKLQLEEELHHTTDSGLTELTATIEQLQKRIAELEAQVPKWINVEERLPDTCAYGLYGTLVDVSDIVATNQGAAVFFDGYWCEVGWDSHDLGKRIQGVTHWMPLPQPSKGG